jgi:hypothetical protein
MKPAKKRKESIMSTETQNAESTETANPPVAKIRVGLVSASIWERVSEKGRFYAVTLERRYRDRDGKWKTSHSYDAGDLLSLAKTADLAHSKILELQANANDE